MSEEIWEAEEAEKKHDEEVDATLEAYDSMSKYAYGCANGCEFDYPAFHDCDVEGNPQYVCPICGTEEFTPNFKENKLEG